MVVSRQLWSQGLENGIIHHKYDLNMGNTKLFVSFYFFM